MRARPSLPILRALVSGVLLLTLASAPLPRAQADTSQYQWLVAPGVIYRQWDTVTAGGPQRVHVFDIDPTVPGVSLDYAHSPYLRDRAQTSTLLTANPATVGGVNGNFFDISDTGAPLGIGRARDHRVLHAPAFGWNNAFYQAADGSYHVGQLHLVAAIAEHPDWSVTGLNTPNVKPDSMTVFTHSWGKSAGWSVINTPGRSLVGRTSSDPGRPAPAPAPRAGVKVREVHVKKGVVVSNYDVLHHGHYVHGQMLVGQGKAAKELATLAVGTPLHVSWSLDQKPLMAITGSQVLVRAGRVVARDDGQNAPRTTVGVDAATGHVMIVATDGRQGFATGYTMRGMASLLVSLGVTDAVNLDGGGSTTVVSRSADGSGTGVVNTPSAGHQRWVADALAVNYTAPPA
jgi:hypothetical protein